MKLISTILTIIFLSCGENNSEKNSGSTNSGSTQNNVADSNVIKVYVNQNGEISANGKSISLSELDSSFSKLKAGNGIVYYSRDNSTQAPPVESMKVMELVVKYSLPIRLYTDKTFTVIVKTN